MERNGRNYNQKPGFPNRFQHRNQLKKPYQDFNNKSSNSSKSHPNHPPLSDHPHNPHQSHYNNQGSSPNSYKNQPKGFQSGLKTTRTPLVNKNSEPFFTPGYYGPESIATLLSGGKKDPEQQQNEILGFKVVHDGRVVHDEMPKGSEWENKRENENNQMHPWNNLNGVNSHKYNEVPNSIEISLPSFTEC